MYVFIVLKRVTMLIRLYMVNEKLWLSVAFVIDVLSIKKEHKIRRHNLYYSPLFSWSFIKKYIKSIIQIC